MASFGLHTYLAPTCWTQDTFFHLSLLWTFTDHGQSVACHGIKQHRLSLPRGFTTGEGKRDRVRVAMWRTVGTVLILTAVSRLSFGGRLGSISRSNTVTLGSRWQWLHKSRDQRKIILRNWNQRSVGIKAMGRKNRYIKNGISTCIKSAKELKRSFFLILGYKFSPEE